MTHEEVGPRLGAYAAGALDEVASEEVRAHLAGGCTECLHELFVRPVGLPRAPSGPAAPSGPPAPDVAPASPPRAPAATASRRGLVIAAVAVTTALASAAAWMAIDLRAREAAHYRAEALRAEWELAAEKKALAALEARAAALDRDVVDLREAASRTPDAAPPPSEDPYLREDLEAARTRIETLSRALRRRERELQRLGSDARDGELMREAVAAPDLELLQMVPVAPFRDVRGHALWHPGADRILVYAYGLPPLPEGGRYRVDLGLSDGREAPGVLLPVEPSGEGMVRVRTDEDHVPPREMSVVLEPGGRAVLRWQRPGP